MSFDNTTKKGSVNTIDSNDKDTSIVTESSSLDEHVPELINTGTFTVKNKKERVGRNPKTKVESKIHSRKVVTFKPSLLLKKKINQ